MQKDNKDFYKLFIHYTQVFIIPIITLSIVLIVVLFSKLAASYKNNNLNILEQSARLIDSHMNSILTMSYQLISSEEMRNIVDVRYEDESMRNFFAWKAAQKIDLFQVNKELFNTVGVYSTKNDIIIQKGVTQTTKEYYERYLPSSTYTYEKFLEKLNQEGNDFFIFSEKGTENGEDISIFCRPIKINNTSGKCVLLLSIDRKWVVSLLEKMGVAEKSGIAILDRDDNLSFSNIPFSFRYDQKHGYHEQGYIVVPRKSNVFQFKYLYFIPQNKAYGNAVNSFIVVLLLMIVAVALGWILAKKYGNHAKGAAFLLMDENRLLSENLDVQIANARERLLIHFLKNDATDDMVELSKKYNMPFDKKHFCVMVLGVPELIENETEVLFEENIILCQKMKEIICEILQKGGITNYTVRFRAGGYVFVLNYDDSQMLSEGLTAIEQILNQNKNLFVLAVGEQKSCISHIYSSYNGALTAFYNCVRHHIGGAIVYYSDIKTMEDSRLYYSLEQENSIIHSVKGGSKDALVDTLNEIYRVNFVERHNSYHVLNRLIFNLVHTVYKVLDETYARDIEKYEQGDRVCKNVMNMEDVEKKFAILREVLISLCNHWRLRGDNNEIKDAVISFIKQNYTNIDLSLDMVAENVNMSYYYLSRLFKDYIGTSFVSYLTMIRVEEAKKLLDETNEKIEDIAYKVGFYSSNSFIKAFKKYCEITPGSYRKRKK